MIVPDALTIATTTGFTREAVEALSAAKAEPAWMLEKRLLAWRIFNEMPMPFWRRTGTAAGCSLAFIRSKSRSTSALAM